MRKLLLLLFLLLFFQGILSAQQCKVYGKIVESISFEPLTGASVICIQTAASCVSNAEGNFELNLMPGTYDLIFSFITYQSDTIRVSLPVTKELNMQTIVLKHQAQSLEGVVILSDFVTDHKTPIAVNTLNAKSIYLKSANHDFPELLKTTPGVYVTRSGGGTGDDRVSIRGFQQENVALLLNGVPVGSMENGLVYWSNWSGLTDATASIQVQRGLGASRVAMNSVGGTINIITKTITSIPSFSVSYSIADYGNTRSSFSFSTGRFRKKFALSGLLSRTNGPGYVDATYVDGWAYFLNFSFEINRKHQINFSCIGSPEKHGQRNYGSSVADFQALGPRYNANWGYYNGKIFNLSENHYHKPLFSINHYWRLGSNSLLSTSLYYSFGKGGGRYTEAFNQSKPLWEYRKNNQIDFDTVVAMNKANSIQWKLSDGSLIEKYSQNILTKYLSDHYWLGIMSTFSRQLSKHARVTSGIHVRYFESHLYEKIDDLLGGKVWIDQYAGSLAGVSDRSQLKYKGDIINVDNQSFIKYSNAFAQLEYNVGNLTSFVSGSATITGFQRSDVYNYPNHPMSEKVVKHGFDTKTGLGYQISNSGNLYFNIGFYSREPYYKFVYAPYSNQVADNSSNEKIFSTEAGYAFRSKLISARLNLYSTWWLDKALFSRENIQLADSNLTRSLVKGLSAWHRGVEFEGAYQTNFGLKISTIASLGLWKWMNDVSAIIYNDVQVITEKLDVYSKGLFVGGAPQTQAGLSAEYRLPIRLTVSVDWVYFDRLYADFEPVNRNNPNDRMQPYRLPAYSVCDVFLAYSFALKAFDVTAQLSCQNLTNTVSITRGDDGTTHNLDSFTGFWLQGRTFNLTTRINWQGKQPVAPN